MQLIYVGDPMCSWCYGFGRSLELALRELPQARLEIVLGGVRAGATDLLDDAGKQFRLGHWARAEALSGLPFNREALLARRGFVYDTEPVCRAVVVARRHVGDRGLLRVFRAFQQAFYVDGEDTTDPVALARIGVLALRAEGCAMEASAFLAEWNSPQAIREAGEDFALARRWGVRSFPALLARDASGVSMVTDGYLRGPELLALLQSRARGVAAASAT